MPAKVVAVVFKGSDLGQDLVDFTSVLLLDAFWNVPAVSRGNTLLAARDTDRQLTTI